MANIATTISLSYYSALKYIWNPFFVTLCVSCLLIFEMHGETIDIKLFSYHMKWLQFLYYMIWNDYFLIWYEMIYLIIISYEMTMIFLSYHIKWLWFPYHIIWNHWFSYHIIWNHWFSYHIIWNFFDFLTIWYEIIMMSISFRSLFLIIFHLFSWKTRNEILFMSCFLEIHR